MTIRAMLASTVLYLSLLSLASPAGAANITHSTGVFTAADWSSFVQGTGSSTAWTEPTGGNPNEYRRVSLTVGPFQSEVNDQLWSVSAFTPSSQGAVSSVSVSYDVTRIFATRPDATQIRKGIAVRQNGITYRYDAGVSIVNHPTWEPVAITNIVPLFPDVDWSCAGSQIVFGFYDSVGTSIDGFTIDGGYDNYVVSIDYQPCATPARVSTWGSIRKLYR